MGSQVDDSKVEYNVFISCLGSRPIHLFCVSLYRVFTFVFSVIQLMISEL